jgi:hypothetical protein
MYCWFLINGNYSLFKKKKKKIIYIIIFKKLNLFGSNILYSHWQYPFNMILISFFTFFFNEV